MHCVLTKELLNYICISTLHLSYLGRSLLLCESCFFANIIMKLDYSIFEERPDVFNYHLPFKLTFEFNEFKGHDVYIN